MSATVEELLKNQFQDEAGNIHFVVNRKLIASFLPNGELRCKVNIEVIYDETWKNYNIKYVGPMVVVYSHPVVEVKTDVPSWLNSLTLLQPFWVIGAINGLGFCGDLFPSTLPIKEGDAAWKLPMAMSSDFERECLLNDKHIMARELLLAITHAIWDDGFFDRQAEAEDLAEIEQLSRIANKLLE